MDQQPFSTGFDLTENLTGMQHSGGINTGLRNDGEGPYATRNSDWDAGNSNDEIFPPAYMWRRETSTLPMPTQSTSVSTTTTTAATHDLDMELMPLGAVLALSAVIFIVACALWLRQYYCECTERQLAREPPSTGNVVMVEGIAFRYPEGADQLDSDDDDQVVDRSLLSAQHGSEERASSPDRRSGDVDEEPQRHLLHGAEQPQPAMVSKGQRSTGVGCLSSNPHTSENPEISISRRKRGRDQGDGHPKSNSQSSEDPDIFIPQRSGSRVQRVGDSTSNSNLSEDFGTPIDLTTGARSRGVGDSSPNLHSTDDSKISALFSGSTNTGVGNFISNSHQRSSVEFAMSSAMVKGCGSSSRVPRLPRSTAISNVPESPASSIPELVQRSRQPLAPKSQVRSQNDVHTEDVRLVVGEETER